MSVAAPMRGWPAVCYFAGSLSVLVLARSWLHWGGGASEYRIELPRARAPWDTSRGEEMEEGAGK